VREAAPDGAAPGLASWRWNAVAVVVFAVALAVALGEVWRADPRAAVPVGNSSAALLALSRADVSFEAWLVDRHARTLARAPWRLFATEHCAPGERTLTLGVPMITMGLLAVPAALLGEPILAYNSAVLVMLFASALSMYLLATDWTGVPAAGIAAGLFFAMHPLRTGSLVHPAEMDIGWTALALFFAQRLLAWGRWRDAVGLALAGALQIAASFYPTLAAFLLAPPLAFWLLRTYGLRRARPAQLAFVAGALLLAAACVLGPYLLERGSAPGRLQRGAHFYAPWAGYLPGQPFFPGWALVGLAALGLVLPRRLGFGALGRDPRAALCAGAFLVALVAGGPLGVTLLAPFGAGLDTPVPYELLSAWLPGLDTVRVVMRLVAGVVLALSLLAAGGVAACVRLAGRRFAVPAAAALVALAAASVLVPVLGRGGAVGIALLEIRPGREILDFFARLEDAGNRGPILELPYEGIDGALLAPARILTAAWHHRRTSACFGSYALPEHEKITALAGALPRPDAVRELAALGFTTVVVHEPKRWPGWPIERRLAQGTGRRYVRLRPLLETEAASAFAIEVDAPPAREPRKTGPAG
jgi:hypothetical protein